MSKNIYVVFFQRVLYEGELCLITHNEASLCFCAYDSSDNRIYVLEFMWHVAVHSPSQPHIHEWVFS